jgi:hypothetical protein
MSDSKSINTSLLEDMISSKNERVFILDLSDLILQTIFDACWASITVGSKHPFAWNHSRHPSGEQYKLHLGIEETGSPEIICIVCHEVLHDPLEHGTSSAGKDLLANVYIAKLIELTESEGTELTSIKVDETALAMLKRPGIQEITIVSWQFKFIFHIPLNRY